MKWPCPRDSTPVRARASATWGGAVTAVSGPHRRPPGTHPPPRRGKGGGCRPAPAPCAPSPGLPAQVHLPGQARERRGHRSGRRDKVDLLPGAGVGTVVLEFAQRAEREHDRAADDLRPQVKAVQVPAGYADQRPGRDRVHLHPGHRRGGPGVLGAALARGMRTSTSPPPAFGRRRGRNKAVNSPPRLASAAVTCSQAPPAGGCRPARASTSTSSSATSPSGIAHPRGSPALRGVAVMIVLVLSNWQSGWPSPGGRRAVRAVPRARPGGPRRDRRPRSALCSRRPVKPAPACWRLRARPDLTRRAESSVDTAGPGRKASQAGRSARNTAFVARCGRSAPPAAARDPGRPRPAAGARDGGPGDTGTERLRAATVHPQARRRRCHPDPPRRAGFASARPAPPGSGRAANGAGNPAPKSRPAGK